jgi:hypothetical protein
MNALLLALCCVLLTACSTGIYPYANDDVEPDEGAIETSFDASVTPSGPSRTPDASTPPWPGSGMGRPDGSLPPTWLLSEAGLAQLLGDGGLLFPGLWGDAWVPYPDPWPVAPDDFEYGCDVYKVPVSCPQSARQGDLCSSASVGVSWCPALAGNGSVDFLRCESVGADRPGTWRSHASAACGYDCRSLEPRSAIIPLATHDCSSRPSISCSHLGQFTSQSAVDMLLGEALAPCGLGHKGLSSVSFDINGCVERVFGSTFSPSQIGCITKALATLRVDCDVPCARPWDGNLAGPF